MQYQVHDWPYEACKACSGFGRATSSLSIFAHAFTLEDHKLNYLLVDFARANIGPLVFTLEMICSFLYL
jgi:hypothetical protein